MTDYDDLIAEAEGREAIDAALAAIRPALDAVDALWAGHVSTHYDGCWRRHAGCLAVLIRSHLDSPQEDA